MNNTNTMKINITKVKFYSMSKKVVFCHVTVVAIGHDVVGRNFDIR